MQCFIASPMVNLREQEVSGRERMNNVRCVREGKKRTRSLVHVARAGNTETPIPSTLLTSAMPSARWSYSAGWQHQSGHSKPLRTAPRSVRSNMPLRHRPSAEWQSPNHPGVKLCGHVVCPASQSAARETGVQLARGMTGRISRHRGWRCMEPS